ncbi:MAG: hypothetical protein Q7T25_01940 [Sideroxyarcus sp.]|nr:hypothetical protein [Sideroxyarcus sp.]
MTAGNPATAFAEVAEGAKTLLASAERYLDESEMRYKRLEIEAKKTVNADPALGYLLLAYIRQLVGDFEGVQERLANARKLNAPSLQVAEASLPCFINLGNFTAARSSYCEAADPRQGHFTNNYESGATCGAFRLQRDFEEVAAKMNLKLPDSIPHAKYRHAAQVLDATATRDDEVSALLDLAGEVLRTRRLFFLGPSPDIDVVDDPESDSCVFMNFRVAGGADNAAAMTVELADMAAERLERIPPGISVGFSSALV